MDKQKILRPVKMGEGEKNQPMLLQTSFPFWCPPALRRSWSTKWIYFFCSIGEMKSSVLKQLGDCINLSSNSKNKKHSVNFSWKNFVIHFSFFSTWSVWQKIYYVFFLTVFHFKHVLLTFFFSVLYLNELNETKKTFFENFFVVVIN